MKNFTKNESREQSLTTSYYRLTGIKEVVSAACYDKLRRLLLYSDDYSIGEAASIYFINELYDYLR